MATESTVNPNGAGLSPSTMSPSTSGSTGETQGGLQAEKKSQGIRFERYYTTPGVDPFDAGWPSHHASGDCPPVREKSCSTLVQPTG